MISSDASRLGSVVSGITIRGHCALSAIDFAVVFVGSLMQRPSPVWISGCVRVLEFDLAVGREFL